jgi:hypothetical protein
LSLAIVGLLLGGRLLKNKKIKKPKAKRSTNVVAVASREANLVRRLRAHLHTLGFRKNDDGQLVTSGTGKDVIRTLHQSRRNDRLKANAAFKAALPDALKHFANGTQIDPSRIKPILKLVKRGTPDSDLSARRALLGRSCVEWIRSPPALSRLG